MHPPTPNNEQITDENNETTTDDAHSISSLVWKPFFIAVVSKFFNMF